MAIHQKSIRAVEEAAIAAPGANTPVLASDIVAPWDGFMRIQILLATSSVVNYTSDDGTNSYTEGLDDSSSISAGDPHTFDVQVSSGVAYNFEVETDGVIRRLIVDWMQEGSNANVAGGAGAPVQVAAEARQTNPTAVDDGDVVRIMADDLGRVVTSPHAPRDRIVHSTTTLSNATETTLQAAVGAGVFLDLIGLIVTSGDSALNRIDIRDSSTGTIRHSAYLAADGGGHTYRGAPITQATANNAWTAQLSTSPSANDVRVTAIFREHN